MDTMQAEQGNNGGTSPRQSSCIVNGPIIVGAGPSGLAVAATLRRHSVPFTILERSDGIADLWTNRTYGRLRLHLPKVFCELPHVRFPPEFPIYPSKREFLRYLHSYTAHFSISPLFGRSVTRARFDEATSLWRVTAVSSADGGEVTEYVSKWLVVASGENAEVVVPRVKGRERFAGEVLHSSEYKSGERFKGKRVLVVGCGNSGMEMCLDLCEHGAIPFMSVRSGVHVLPREMLGSSTFGIAMKLLRWLPVKLVDRFLLLVAKLILGDTEKYGLKRPKLGPLEIKEVTGKSPVLDVGAWSLIKSGNIKVVAEVESLGCNGARFVDGNEMAFDALIFATGYRSNVPSWLQDDGFFTEDGKPKARCPSNWRGPNGLYCVGFSGRGLLGAGADAVRAAADIAGSWQEEMVAAGAGAGAATISPV
ncbi:Flavin-containing monooxygenase YUCCA3 [Hordeum vulgare]|uniref:Flavin-containing monooxygenase n=1 Tax=Hordeum vulgare subsp. vulgare TaxID=112509 RepID=A0A8I6X4H0_HORVV|nr:indole-3-pyruvate monooxygenase YUCCA8-like [Hordeum vulgare subsp. vulgare]KAE8807603.1 Flavin-containing monooxygenase YUCCA3 [Hordeum vulgare]